MITLNEAHNLVINSLNDLKSRKMQLSPDDIAADIINVGCKWILEKCPRRPNVADMPQLTFADNYYNFSDIASVFPKAVVREYPYISQFIDDLTKSICLNIGWIGMPSFLDDYFYKNHGVSSGQNIVVFMSSFHKRYQSGRFIEESVVPRKIELSFNNNEQNLDVTITPSLSRKTSKLRYNNGSTRIYEGDGYRYTIKFDIFEEVSHFTLELIERDLKLEYYE